MPKNTKPTSEKTVDNAKHNKDKGLVSVIIGVGLLLSVISIGYSTTVIALGTEGYVPLIMVAPQAILALIVAIRQFVK